MQSKVRAEVPVSRSWTARGFYTHHDASEQTPALPTVGVWHHVSIADGQEGDGDEPHGAQKVAGHFLLVMVPGVGDRQGLVIHTTLTHHRPNNGDRTLGLVFSWM